MKETNWIGESGGKASDPANWDNGVPDYRTKAVIDVDERTEIIWDLKSLGIPVEMLCDPEYVVIYIGVRPSGLQVRFLYYLLAD